MFTSLRTLMDQAATAHCGIRSMDRHRQNWTLCFAKSPTVRECTSVPERFKLRASAMILRVSDSPVRPNGKKAAPGRLKQLARLSQPPAQAPTLGSQFALLVPTPT